MELAQAIAKHHVVGLDTNLFIYAYQEHPKYLPVVRPIFARLDNDSDFRAVTSMITLIQVITQPLRLNRPDLVDIYTNALLNSPNVLTLPTDSTIAHRAAELRARFNLRTPDAIQLATALVAQADVFITNDERLKNVADIPVLIIGEYT